MQQQRVLNVVRLEQRRFVHNVAQNVLLHRLRLRRRHSVVSAALAARRAQRGVLNAATN